MEKCKKHNLVDLMPSSADLSHLSDRTKTDLFVECSIVGNFQGIKVCTECLATGIVRDGKFKRFGSNHFLTKAQEIANRYTFPIPFIKK